MMKSQLVRWLVIIRVHLSPAALSTAPPHYPVLFLGWAGKTPRDTEELGFLAVTEGSNIICKNPPESQRSYM